MTANIKFEDLLPETKKKLRLDPKLVPDKVIALGRVFQALQALTTRDAYWVLRIATSYVPGFKRTLTRGRQHPVDKKKGVNHEPR